MKKFALKKLIYYFIAFIVPVILVGIGYVNLEISPFGGKSLLSMDLWGQYMPMFKEQYLRNRELMGGFYSWNGALGFNFYAQSAYYCNSLFNYIFLFFDSAQLIDVLDYIILAKFGLSSAAFLMFLDYKFKNINLFALAFAIAYGLCSYNIAFLNQPMWTDLVIILPIVIIGLDRLIFEKKPLLYCISLAFAIFSNFYISFSLCIFSVLYFSAEMFILKSELNRKDFIEKIVMFAAYSILAGGLAAFVILPVYNSIMLRAESSKTIEGIDFYHSISENISSLFPLAKVSHGYGVPNIYSGVFVIFMTILFAANRSISLKRKIVFLSIIGFMFLSMNLNILDFVWHGFHFPNQLPGRWTFIFSFVVLFMSYEAVFRIEGLQAPGILLSLFISMIIMAFGKTPEDDLNGNFIIAIILFMTVYCASVLAASIFKRKADKIKNINRKNKMILGKSIAMAFLGIVMTAEVGLNAVKVIGRDTKVSGLQKYQFIDNFMEAAVEKYDCGNDDFYRMDLNKQWTFNSGQLFNYKGVSYYSSTMTGNTYNLLKNLGYRVYAQNVSSVFNLDSPVIDSVFAIKYAIDRDVSFNNAAFTLAEKDELYGKWKIYENKYYLPIAFVTEPEILEWLEQPVNPIQAHNDFLKYAVNDPNIEVFEKIQEPESTITNANVDDYNGNWDERYYHRIESDRPVIFKYNFVCEEQGQYFIQQNFKKGDFVVDSKFGSEKFAVKDYPFKSIGVFEKGDAVEMTLEVNDVDLGLYGIEIYRFDEERFAEAYNILSDEVLNVNEFCDTKIKGTVDVKENGKILYTSIPNDGGWIIKCDGKEMDIKEIGGNLIGIDIDSGKHEIELEYSVPGLGLGICLSVLSIVILSGLFFVGRVCFKTKM